MALKEDEQVGSLKPSTSDYKVAVTAACRSLNQLENEYPVVQKKIVEWVAARQKIVQTIDHLQKKIDSVHTGATVARGAGAAGGVVGGTLSLAGIVMAWRGSRNATTVMECGRALSTLGTVTSASATLIELGYTQKVINEINRELKEHDDMSELLSNWIQRSYLLNSMLVKIFGCSIQSDTIKNVMAICSECITILQIGEHEVKDLIYDFACNKFCAENFLTTGEIDFEAITEKVSHFLRILRDHPELRESLHKICNTLRENPLILEFSKLSLKVYLDIHSPKDNNILPVSMTDLDDPKTSTEALLKMGVFEAVKIATDVLSLIFVAQDIQEGKSKYSKQLDLLKKALSMELNTVLNNYPDLYHQVQQS